MSGPGTYAKSSIKFPEDLRSSSRLWSSPNLPQNSRLPSNGKNGDKPEEYPPPANAEHENAWNLTFIFI